MTETRNSKSGEHSTKLRDGRRRVRYVVAMSLDGYIAGPDGEYDWIVMDPEIDFKSLFAQFDTLLMGRKTYDGFKSASGGMGSGMKVIVFSTTLDQKDSGNPEIVSTNPSHVIERLRSTVGKDIWLFGGGQLFESLLELDLVDTVEVAVMPVLLGAGIPFLPSATSPKKLTLTNHRIYSTGIVSLEYSIGEISTSTDRI